MAKRRQTAARARSTSVTPAEQLNQAVDAAMRKAKLPRMNAGVEALLRIAGELQTMPRPEFKDRLKADLAKRSRAMNQSQGIPDLRRGVATPYLMIRDASRALDFYKQAFGATELSRMADPSGHIAHAEIKVGDAPIMIADEEPRYHNLSPEALGGSSAFIHIYVDDIDAFARRAERGGAKVLEPPQDLPYGDRRGKFVDPFGHVWMVATHQRDVSAEEMKRQWEESQKARTSSEPDARPEGYHSITPYLQVNGAARLIDFLKRAFDAEEIMRVNQPDGTIGHAQMKVAGSMIELADASEQFKPNPTAIWLFVDDVDATYEQALKAGATSIQAPMDQDYGNREGSIKDSFGNHWYIATPLKETSWAPELRTVTPYLHPHGASKLIDFLKDAFGGQVIERHADDQGVIQHAQIKIGDSIVAMGEAHGPYGPMPPALHLYVRDTDAAYRQALRAGAKSLYAPRDEAYGDRSGGVTDPFDNVWYIGTHRNPAQREAAAATSQPAPTQERQGSIMPFMYFDDAVAAADYYKKVFEATELHRDTQADGRVTHVGIAIGGTHLMLSDVNTAHVAPAVAKGFARTARQLGGTPTHLYLYVPDADAAYQRALQSGSTIVDPMEDKSWGDRCGGVKDPFGQIWYIATPLEDVKR